MHLKFFEWRSSIFRWECVFGVGLLAFKDVNNVDQYRWIAEDIRKRHEDGVSYSDMVILARKNSLLDKIEYQLLSHNFHFRTT